jgi:hypothetical protein
MGRYLRGGTPDKVARAIKLYLAMQSLKSGVLAPMDNFELPSNITR